MRKPDVDKHRARLAITKARAPEIIRSDDAGPVNQAVPRTLSRMPSKVTHVWIDDLLVQGPWERIEPPTPCDSPDGHTAIDVLVAGHEVPVRSFCSRCGADYSIAAVTL
jgi:hypothetical protein